MGRRLVLGLLLSVLAACGGKTGLSFDVDGDASTRDAAVDRDATVDRDAAVERDAGDGGVVPDPCLPECGVHAECINTTCACLPGYIGDGFMCERPIVAEVAAGPFRACAGIAEGTLRCWGDNTLGALGDGTQENRYTGVAVIGIRDAVQLGLGSFHACARMADGSVLCWGGNNVGQLGNGGADTQGAPSLAVGVSDAVDLAAGSAVTCVRHASGRVSCWGLGVPGAGGMEQSVPVDVPGLALAEEIALGESHGCARWSDGGVSCWGGNGHGQLGDGTSGEQWAPVAVLGLTGAVEIEAGNHHSCARMANGTVQCWGANERGQVGDGSYGVDRFMPTFVSGLVDAVELAVGDEHSCARLMDGSVVCWGANEYGQAGQGDAPGWNVIPFPVPELSGAVALALGNSHSCARVSDGSVRCWGNSSSGQLGAGMTAGGVTPVTVIW